MISEEQIEKFRREMLPKYMEMAEKLKHNKCITKIFEVHYIDKSELKQCSKCKQWLPMEEFKFGRTYCRTCEKIRVVMRQKKSPQ